MDQKKRQDIGSLTVRAITNKYLNFVSPAIEERDFATAFNVMAQFGAIGSHVHPNYYFIGASTNDLHIFSGDDLYEALAGGVNCGGTFWIATKTLISALEKAKMGDSSELDITKTYFETNLSLAQKPFEDNT